MPVVCRNTQKKIVFMLGWEDKVGQLLVYNGGEKKHAAYHWVWFLLGQRSGRLNPKWSIEDKEPVVNELMVETAMFPFCWPDVSETGPDSLTVKLTDLFPEEKNPRRLVVCVRHDVEVGTPQDYRFLWTKHAVKKKQDGTRLRSRGGPSGRK